MTESHPESQRIPGKWIALSLVGAAVIIAPVFLVVGWSYRPQPGPEEESTGTPASTKATPKDISLAPTDTTDWPHLFGPKLNSTSGESDLQWKWTDAGPPEVWRKEVGTGYSSPVVSRGKLIILQRMGDEEIIACLDAATGAPQWEHRYPTTYKCRYEYSSGPYSTPVIRTADATISKSQGDDVESSSPDGDDLAQPTDTRAWVYSLGGQGQARCLNLETGDVRWQRELMKDFQVPDGLFAVGASPLVAEGKVFIPLGGEPEAGIVALSAETGETEWTATDHAASYTTPKLATMHGRKILFVLTFEGLVALNPNDGHVHWQIPFRAKAPDSVNATTPLIKDNKVLMVAGPGPGSVCIEVQQDGSYRELWRDRRVLDSQFNTLTEVSGFVFGFTSKRQRSSLRCVELNSGQLRWKHDSDLERGTLIAVDNHLLLWGEHGHLGSLKMDSSAPKPVSLTTEPLLKSPCYSAPALGNGYLYLRNEEFVVCYDLRKKQQEAAE